MNRQMIDVGDKCRPPLPVDARTSRPILFDEAIVGQDPLEFLNGFLQVSIEVSVIGKDLDGTIVLWNEGARRTYGYEPEEVVGKANCSILHTPKDVRAGLPRDMIRIAIRDGQWSGIYDGMRKNGESFIARSVVNPRRDKNGNVVGTLVFARDTHGELLMAEKLRATQFYARSLLEASLDPLVTIDPQGKITDMNEALVEATGLPRAKLLETDFSAYFTEPEKARQAYELAFSRGFVRDYALALRHVSGAIIEVLYNASVYKNDQGEVLGVFAAARDITERKRFEESLVKASRMKSEFLAGMSHELRTPLNGIIGFTEFLIDEKPGPLLPRQKEYLNDVLDSARHLLQLINDVLDLTKIEAGKMVLRPEIFSIRKAVSEVVAIMNASAGKKRIAVGVEVGKGLDDVLLDQQKFRQVLYNQLSNAIKFTDAGGSVDVTARRGNGEQVELCVRDTGIGIRPEDMERVFLEFEQLDSGISRHFEGTGLGLALIKRIVGFQGGRISVASEPGVGSSFTVLLPLAGRETESE